MCSATQEFELVASTTHSLKGYALVHDIAVTENHIVVFQVTQRIAAGSQMFKSLVSAELCVISHPQALDVMKRISICH